MRTFCQAIQVADFRMMRERFQPVGCRCGGPCLLRNLQTTGCVAEWAGSQHERHPALRATAIVQRLAGFIFRQTIEGFERHVIRASQ